MDLAEEGQTITQLREQLLEDDDPRGPLIDIADYIKRNLGPIRKLIEAQQRSTEKRGRRQRHDPSSAEVRGTHHTRERQQQGFLGASDPGEGAPAKGEDGGY